MSSNLGLSSSDAYHPYAYICMKVGEPPVPSRDPRTRCWTCVIPAKGRKNKYPVMSTGWFQPFAKENYFVQVDQLLYSVMQRYREYCDVQRAEGKNLSVRRKDAMEHKQVGSWNILGSLWCGFWIQIPLSLTPYHFEMKAPSFLSIFVAWCWIATFAAGQEQWPLHNDGINSFVEWYAGDALEEWTLLIILLGTTTAIFSMDSGCSSGQARFEFRIPRIGINWRVLDALLAIPSARDVDRYSSKSQSRRVSGH